MRNSKEIHRGELSAWHMIGDVAMLRTKPRVHQCTCCWLAIWAEELLVSGKKEDKRRQRKNCDSEITKMNSLIMTLIQTPS